MKLFIDVFIGQIHHILHNTMGLLIGKLGSILLQLVIQESFYSLEIVFESWIDNKIIKKELLVI